MFGTFLCFHTLGIILATDELIFFIEVGQPPTTNNVYIHDFNWKMIQDVVNFLLRWVNSWLSYHLMWCMTVWHTTTWKTSKVKLTCRNWDLLGWSNWWLGCFGWILWWLVFFCGCFVMLLFFLIVVLLFFFVFFTFANLGWFYLGTCLIYVPLWYIERLGWHPPRDFFKNMWEARLKKSG